MTFQHDTSIHTSPAVLLYLHGEGGRLLVVVVEAVGHEGGVVGQPLAHAQRDGLAGEQAVAARRRVHRDGHARRQHGHGQHPQEAHGGAAGRKWTGDESRGSVSGPVRRREGPTQRKLTRHSWLKTAGSIARTRWGR